MCKIKSEQYKAIGHVVREKILSAESEGFWFIGFCVCLCVSVLERFSEEESVGLST